MDKEELVKETKETIKYAYEHDDDYVNWIYVEYLQEFVKAKEGEDKCQL